MRKKPETKAEDVMFVAERQYQRMLDHVEEGTIDINEIVIAMEGINNAHRFARKENKGHLIR